MAKDPELKTKLVTTALEIAAEQGWRRTGLREVAERAEVSMADLYAQFCSKTALLGGFSAMADRAMLEDVQPDEDSGVRDTLFDALMARFEFMHQHRDGFIAVLRDLPTDPVTGLSLVPKLDAAMAWALEAAGVSTSGLRGRVRIRVLGVVYMDVMRVWARDDSPDLPKTMKALDQRLDQLDQFARSFDRDRPANPFSALRRGAFGRFGGDDDLAAQGYATATSGGPMSDLGGAPADPSTAGDTLDGDTPAGDTLDRGTLDANGRTDGPGNTTGSGSETGSEAGTDTQA